jgi:2-methylcitrate dehydratase PrpD
MNFGTDTKPLHAGFAARAGIVAVELARRGATARTDALEAPMGFFDLYGDPSPRSLDLSPEHATLVSPGIELKPYPSCRFTHRVIDAVRAIVARERDRGEPTSIECSVDPFSKKILIYAAPASGQEAKFSMRYCAAVAWLDARIAVDSFSDERAARDDVRRLLARVTLIDAPGASETVTVRFADGRSATETVTLAKGHPDNPMTPVELGEKIHACCDAVLGEMRTDALVAEVRNLPGAATLAPLSALLEPEHVAQEPAR